MDKILSARVDEEVANLLDALSRKQRKTKKKILEEALRGYAAQGSGEPPLDVLKETWGAWNRRESAAVTVRKARSAFRNSLARRSR
jgi:hypothetical protein